jgi:hypothetical protein
MDVVADRAEFLFFQGENSAPLNLTATRQMVYEGNKWIVKNTTGTQDTRTAVFMKATHPVANNAELGIIWVADENTIPQTPVATNVGVTDVWFDIDNIGQFVYGLP